MRRTTSAPLLIALAALAGCTAARPSAAPTARAADGDAASMIRESDLRRDLFALAGDEMRGRGAGTIDELRASAWVAERAREAGLEPAGVDGTYFQFFPMRRIRVSSASRVALAGGGSTTTLEMERDWVPYTRVNADVDLPIVWVGDARGPALERIDLRGKAVAARLLPPTTLPAPDVSLREFRWALSSLAQRTAELQARGAAAIVLVSDSVADRGWEFAAGGLARGRYLLDTAGADVVPAGTPVLWVRGALAERLARPGQRLAARLAVESFAYPSVNVVARMPGRDPALRGQYVLFSGHQDHDGVRPVAGGDSIYNGADDNATVTVAMLAIGRAFAREPGRRSALFVWHGAEERGLLGSRWYVANPTVPRDSIVAVLNGDMIGRNHPDSAALLGVTPPHRNSMDLVRAALDANDRVTRFAIDSTWDRPTHPEGWYFRSDHLPYARAGIPAIFFTTLLHPDYHTPRDEPAGIDVAKLARMTRWMYETGRAIAEADRRPAVDPGFRLER